MHWHEKFLDQLALQAICHFRIPQAVPPDTPISFSDLAGKCSIPEAQLTRLVRHGMNLHLFYEPQHGLVAHTTDTALLAQDDTLHSLVLTMLELLRPASLKVTAAMEKWPASDEPTETGWQLVYGTDKPMYESMREDPEVTRRFSAHLEHIAKQDPRAGERVAAMFPWGDHPGALVVDLGGGNGQYSAAVASAHRDLRFVVQDRPGVSARGRATLPGALAGRVGFADHDMFEPQTVRADMYFLRHVFHNWGDAYCVRILRALAPALRPGARVLVCDLVVPARGAAPAVEVTETRRIDLLMFSLFNARERTVEEIAAIFKAADERWDFVAAHGSPGCHDKICEAVWRG